MKKYNIQNYIRYKEDLKLSMPEGLFWDEYTRDELVIKFMYLVENLARKFSTSQQASGVMTINDLIQEGSIGLISAVDKIDWSMIRGKIFLLRRILKLKNQNGIRRKQKVAKLLPSINSTQTPTVRIT